MFKMDAWFSLLPVAVKCTDKTSSDQSRGSFLFMMNNIRILVAQP